MKMYSSTDNITLSGLTLNNASVARLAAGVGPSWSSTGTATMNGQPRNMFFDIFDDKIRNAIYRASLVRPTTIVPVKKSNGRWSYNWNAAGEIKSDSNSIPSHQPQRIEHVWQTVPTEAQIALIKAKKYKGHPKTDVCHLDKYFDNDLLAEVTPCIHFRNDPSTAVIINKAMVVTTAISGLNLLLTCKQAAIEGCRVLYGQNSFSFDVRGLPPYILNHVALQPMVKNIFGPKSQQRQFVHKDPIYSWIRRIGCFNSTFIPAIKIEGSFEVVKKTLYKTTLKQSLTLDRLLPIYSALLLKACVQLKVITIHQYLPSELPDKVNTNDPNHREDRSVQNLIEKVTTIESLHLVAYKNPPTTTKILDELWGNAINSISFIRKRTEGRRRALALEMARKARDEHMKTKLLGQEQNQPKGPGLGADFGMTLQEAMALQKLEQAKKNPKQKT